MRFEDTYEYGYNGRMHGVPFNVHASAEWKAGWLMRDDEIREKADEDRLALEERIAHNQRVWAERVKNDRASEQNATMSYAVVDQAARLERQQRQHQRQQANQAAHAAESQRLRNIRSGASKGKKG